MLCSRGLSRSTLRSQRANALLVVPSRSGCSKPANIPKDRDVALITCQAGDQEDTTSVGASPVGFVNVSAEDQADVTAQREEPMDFRKLAFSILLSLLSLTS